MRRFVSAVVLSALLGAAGVITTPLVASAAVAPRSITDFACPPSGGSQFTDTASSPHAGAIECIVGYDLARGTTSTTFSPGRSVTRGQMATFLANFLFFTGDGLLGFEPTGPREFTDVAGTTHEDNIYILQALGIVQGTSPTTFSPNRPVTRGQMATFLVRTMELLEFPPPADAPDAFTDDQASVHQAAINTIAALGIAQGTSPGIYQPGSAVARGAMATFLARLLDLGIEHGVVVPFIESEALAAMSGGAVAPGPGATATGTAYIATTDVEGVVCFEMDGVAGASGIHVHQGAPDATGPVVATIPLPASGDVVFGCTRSASASAIGLEPDGFYVDVHTAAFPEGAVRGQLGTIETSASAELDAEQVVPGPGADGAFGFAFVATTSQPDVVCVQAAVLAAASGEDVAFTALHIHQGALHANGPVVLDVPVAPDDPFVSRCVEDPIASSLATDPDAFYVDVHSVEHPEGMLRGQLADDGFFTELAHTSAAPAAVSSSRSS